MATENIHNLDPICTEDPYPLYPAGEYEVRCFGATIYRDPRFRTWKCRLDCHFLDDSGDVAGFLNLGSGEKPKAGRGSRYRRVWTMANGEAPRKRQQLSRKVFMEKNFWVRIADVKTRHDQREHLPEEHYSTIQEFIRRTYP